MTNWYILFVVTGYEQDISNRIDMMFKNEDLNAFIPKKEILFRKLGKVLKEAKIMFPGYVFIESSLYDFEFLQHKRRILATSKNIIRLLAYGNSTEVAIREEECKILRHLFNGSYCVESSVGFIKGDKILIEKGPLKGREGIIIKINRHRMVAYISLEIMGSYATANVGLEVLSKTWK